MAYNKFKAHEYYMKHRKLKGKKRSKALTGLGSKPDIFISGLASGTKSLSGVKSLSSIKGTSVSGVKSASMSGIKSTSMSGIKTGSKKKKKSKKR